METKVEYTFETSTEVSRETALPYTYQFISSLGYEDPEGVSDWTEHDKLIAVGLGALEDCPPLSRGDHVLAMRRRSRTGQLSRDRMVELAKLYKVSVSRLYSNATTAENFELDRRNLSENVGYSHLEALNGLPTEKQDEFLSQAEVNALSVEALCELVNQYKRGQVIAESDEFTGAIDQTIPDIGNEENSINPENNLNGIGGNSQSTEDKPRPDNEYEQLADELEGDADAYSWGHEVENDRRGLTTLASDPIAAAEQMVALIKTGAINEGWIATFIAALTQKMGV